jgi:hypothetical protein
LAAFQNPEFYRAQAMRLLTYDKPRVIACAEQCPHHLGLPRGCRDDLRDLLHDLDIRLLIRDERHAGDARQRHAAQWPSGSTWSARLRV